MSVLTMLVLVSPAIAQNTPLKGIALVVAQSDYENLPDLANTANDAREIQKLLADLGFEVQTVNDGDRKRLDRQLERFVEDAEEADVALLYYSGHGIEAGGQNFLVPVDADLSALDAADARLVPLGVHLETLRGTVPISIVLLDACRTNPFPPGALLKTADAQEGLPVTPAGLGQPRSVTPFAARSGAKEETFGSVIGYAAEPGQVALDGEPGGNSPYADALVRHLSAMAGEEFGLVLRMVAEEVYLKTRGAQRPWVNESLRRLLYLGAAPDEPEGPEGDILHERRKLLVTISTLPDKSRREVEAISATDSVPMDAIYAMLASLGENAPKDPGELDRLLRSQAEKLRQMRAERDAVSTSDPEIGRLTDLANKAVDEGAITSAISLHELIKARIGELSERIDTVEANLKARRLEFAAAYARSAETLNLSFDYVGAARDYHSAFEEVKRWDSALAWEYRLNEGLALWNHGDQRGDSASIRKAIEVYRDALEYKTNDPGDHPLTLNNIGVAFTELGTRLGDPAMLREAAAAHRKALEVYTRDFDKGQWAWTQSLLANALLMASEYHTDQQLFEEAITAYRAALEVRTREDTPIDWARVNQNMGIAYLGVARREDSVAAADDAIASFKRALEIFTRDRIPAEWINTQTNLAAALRLKAGLAKDTNLLREASALYREVLAAVDRDAYPLQWANAYNNLANVFRDFGMETKDASFLEAALDIYDEVLKVNSLEHTPLSWAQSHGNRASTLRDLARMKDGDTALLEQAVAEYRVALKAYTRETAPADWAATTLALGELLDELAVKTGNEAARREAGEALRAALSGYDRTRAPAAWAYARDRLARYEYDLGSKNGDAALLRSAAEGYREASSSSRSRTAESDAGTDYNIGLAFVELAKLTGSADDRRAAVAAFRQAARAYETSGNMEDLAKTRHFMGMELLELSLAEGSIELATEAAAVLRQRLEKAPAGLADPDPAIAWNELGRALQHSADLRSAADGLPEAAEAFLEASRLFSAGNNAVDTAISLQNAGLVELSLGERTDAKAENFDRAIAHLRQAADAFARTGEAGSANQARYNLARALDAKAVLLGDVAMLSEAIDLYRGTLDGWPDDGSRSIDWAFNQTQLGHALQARAGLTGPQGRADYLAAIEAFAAAEQAYPEATAPVDFAAVRNSVAFARILLAESTRDAAGFETAVADARRALSVQMASGDTGNLPYIRDTLCRALTGLGEERGDRAALAEAIANCEQAVGEFKAADAAEFVAETEGNLARARKALSALQ
ncbi:MAG: caspase family protein [Mesorhizobium sp.]|nr:caspase family protein [Mesorhizobium sp.]MCO5160417.1 caspase family protein [Mesorhizobium sp.]